MKTETTRVIKHTFSNCDRLDPVHVFIEDIGKGQGRITITCYGKAWSCYWGGMGTDSISEFFCSCNEQYLTEKLAPMLDSTVYDIDRIRENAEKKGVECWRDDPWNDYEFMQKMYGNDMCEWGDNLPKMENHEYSYLCRIIKAIQDGLKYIDEGLKSVAG